MLQLDFEYLRKVIKNILAQMPTKMERKSDAFFFSINLQGIWHWFSFQAYSSRHR